MFNSGDLRESVTFQKRAAVSDDYGNEQTGAWTDQFTVFASIMAARGREEVLAQRLQGVRPVEIQVWQTPDTMKIDPSWRAVNARNRNEVYALHDIRDPDGLKQVHIITATLGGAS